jgi:hypothetical protein
MRKGYAIGIMSIKLYWGNKKKRGRGLGVFNFNVS